MAYAFEIWTPPFLPVAGADDLFPVRRIYCVGRNYAAHAREMGHDDREPPFFFAKPADAVVHDAATLPYPKATRDLHHEVELVAAIGPGALAFAGRDIPADRALDAVFGYAVGIDLTRRDLQAQAKAQARPWDMAKGFDRSAPCGAIRRAAEIGHPTAAAIRLRVNGQVRQEGDIADMVWSVPETIAALSALVELRPGDLIFTGTPEGVGPIAAGDILQAEVEGVGALTVTIG